MFSKSFLTEQKLNSIKGTTFSAIQIESETFTCYFYPEKLILYNSNKV